MSRKTKRLFATAWILFFISLFLPAVTIATGDKMFGWNCAATCAWMVTDLNGWGEIYYFIFTIPNLLMFFSPLMIYRLKRRGRKIGWLNGVALFCALYVLAFGFIHWFSGDFNLKIGYYLWLISFWLLFLGFFWMRREIHSNHISPAPGREATA
jgi:hypothetical protein